MKRYVVLAFLLVAGAELIALAAGDRRLILIVSGTAVAVSLLGLRWYLIRDTGAVAGETPADDAAKGLQRWLSRTETLIGNSESTRRDWDRHLRPMLARQFEIATGQKRSKDSTAYHATGRMLFGAELWDWVNPENVARSGADAPGPGRAALDEILQRLERV
ncbi:hypothetical protein [Mycobacterium sp. IDR2000157661]|uniref:hypothetical protein n=1 Tax=Mycobacterium sp. IDR2000157661 TaxID=2867005 RepID=UPI001EED7154|nr:hypothetical protein [Mycobacterium sp. IDR2000157661]ULE34631.1 hypothetical protein K3G64_08540 [Mycobacterium sp. IDR2000157661]